MSESEAEYAPLMPFVACVSNGGPYDDAAFVAGFECGAIDGALAASKHIGVVLHRWVSPSVIPQLDLIAMRHGQKLTRQQFSEDGEWQRVEIGHPLVVADEDAS